MDGISAEKALHKARSMKEKLTGQINPRAMALLQQAEKNQEVCLIWFEPRCTHTWMSTASLKV